MKLSENQQREHFKDEIISLKQTVWTKILHLRRGLNKCTKDFHPTHKVSK